MRETPPVCINWKSVGLHAFSLCEYYRVLCDVSLLVQAFQFDHVAKPFFKLQYSIAGASVIIAVFGGWHFFSNI